MYVTRTNETSLKVADGCMREKIAPFGQWDPEPRMSVLARASSNLPGIYKAVRELTAGKHMITEAEENPLMGATT
jgi:hypothetical protein